MYWKICNIVTFVKVMIVFKFMGYNLTNKQKETVAWQINALHNHSVSGVVNHIFKIS